MRFNESLADLASQSLHNLKCQESLERRTLGQKKYCSLVQRYG